MTRARRPGEIAAVTVGAFLAALMLVYRDIPVFTGPTATAFVLLMATWIAVQDAARFTIPDGPLIALALVGIAGRLTAAVNPIGIDALSIAVDAGLCGGALLAIREAFYRLRGIDGLGFGDVKLAVAGGILLGTVGFAWALCLASFAGLAFVLAASCFKPGKNVDRLPFGAFLAPLCGCLWTFPIDAVHPGLL